MTTEGHDCWEDCDEGPHGCVCGNDCLPPLREQLIPIFWEVFDPDASTHGNVQAALDAAVPIIEARIAAELRQERERADDLERNRSAWIADAHELANAAQAALSRAEETIARIRAARSNHPECDKHDDADPVTCGWKRAVQDIDAALAAHEKGQQS